MPDQLKYTPYARCGLCGAPMDVPGRPWSINCGGDCAACVAEAESGFPADSDLSLQRIETMVMAFGDAAEKIHAPGTTDQALAVYLASTAGEAALHAIRTAFALRLKPDTKSVSSGAMQ